MNDAMIFSSEALKICAGSSLMQLGLSVTGDRKVHVDFMNSLTQPVTQESVPSQAELESTNND